jgi:hypothetical protein
MNVSQYLHSSFSEGELSRKYEYLTSTMIPNPCSIQELKEALEKRQIGRLISKHNPNEYKRLKNHLRNA